MLIGVIAEETLLPLVIAPSRFIDGDPFLAQFLGWSDWFYQSRSTIIGFVMPGLVDETDGGVWTPTAGAVPGAPEGVQTPYGPNAAEIFIQNYVTNGYLGLWPDLVDDTLPEIFYSPTRSTQPILQPPPGIDFDLIYAPVIPVIPPLAPRAVYVDTDVFFVAVFEAGLGPDLFVDDDIIRAQIIRRDGYDPLTLLPDTFNDIDVFYAATTPRAVLPGLVADSDVIYAVSQGASPLQPILFSDADTFFVSFVVSQLQPSRVVDVETVFGHVVGTPGRLELFIDDDIFRTASVQFGPLRPPLIVEADVFYTVPWIGQNPPIRPLDWIVDILDTFYPPVMTQNLGIAPNIWIDTEIFSGAYSIIVGTVFHPPFLNDSVNDAVFAPQIDAFETMYPPLFSDVDVIFAPFEATAIFHPPLLSDDALIELVYAPTAFMPVAPNVVVAADVFYPASIISGRALTVMISASRAGVASPIYTEDNTGYSRLVVGVGAVMIQQTMPTTFGAWTVSASRAGLSSSIAAADGSGKTQTLSNIGSVT